MAAITPDQVLRLHVDGFNRALLHQDYGALEVIYSDSYMLVRSDGSVLNKAQVLQDLRDQGLTFHIMELKDALVRVFGSAAVLTAEGRSLTSRNGKELESHFRLVAVYAQEGNAVRLVHFQSTLA